MPTMTKRNTDCRQAFFQTQWPAPLLRHDAGCSCMCLQTHSQFDGSSGNSTSDSSTPVTIPPTPQAPGRPMVSKGPHRPFPVQPPARHPPARWPRIFVPSHDDTIDQVPWIGGLGAQTESVMLPGYAHTGAWTQSAGSSLANQDDLHHSFGSHHSDVNDISQALPPSADRSHEVFDTSFLNGQFGGNRLPSGADTSASWYGDLT